MICPANRIRIQTILKSFSPDLLDNSFKDSIKYLGILLGPDAMKHQYEEVLRGCPEILDFLCVIDMDFILPVALYNILAISKLNYIASFVIPPRATLQIERRILQRPMRNPHRLKLLGLKIQ